MESNLTITSGSVSDRGLSPKRPQNEDSFLEMGNFSIYAVADGVGGAQAGEVASQMAVEILGEAFANRKAGDDAETVMRAAIGQANSAIYQMAQELPQLSSMATTVVALHLAGGIATIGHVGDSRLYRVDRDGNLFAETADHSMVGDEVRAGRMTPEQAENHPSRNIINRALGAESTVDIDLKTIIAEPGTAFLLCSDGITRHVTDQEIKGVLTFGGTPSEVCEYLKNVCYDRGAEDNLTAVVVKVAMDQSAARETFPAVSVSYLEEPTVATARTTFEEPVPDDGDELLELETMELVFPEEATVENPPRDHDSDALQVSTQQDNGYAVAPTPTEQPSDQDSFSMFGDSISAAEKSESSGTIGKAITALAMLVLGSLIGLGVYHFALAPKADDPIDQKLSVMKTDDIAFSSFEKLRRNVDADPAAYIKEIPPADDAEDYYLIGRAYLLVGDFPKSRLALIEAQKLLSKADTSNSRVLNSDIATALAIANDPTLQNRFKLELEANQKLLSNTANSNTSR